MMANKKKAKKAKNKIKRVVVIVIVKGEKKEGLADIQKLTICFSLISSYEKYKSEAKSVLFTSVISIHTITFLQ